MAELIVRGGRIVTARGVQAADVAIENGRIVSVGKDLDLDADKTIDATGLLVFPGIIDVHTHPV